MHITDNKQEKSSVMKSSCLFFMKWLKQGRNIYWLGAWVFNGNHDDTFKVIRHGMYKLLVISCLAMGCFNHSIFLSEAYGDTGKKHVLLINSYSKGYAWTDNEVQGVEDILSEDSSIILKTEYMDTKVINTSEYYELLQELYAKKYSESRFDVIITTDDDAFIFIKRYRDTLFPGVPVVFCGVNNYVPAEIEDFTNYTGVNEQADFKANISLVLALHPDTEKIYVINDRMTTASLLQQEFNHATMQFLDQAEFVYLPDLSLDGLQDSLAAISGNSIVFYLSFFKDAEGKSYTPMEALPALSQATTVPMYGAVDYMLGYGIVGGMLKSSYFQGETAAKLALQVLSGTRVSSIPVVTQSPNQYMFDYRQLRRHAIDVGKLPEGSIIAYEPETFYYKYKKLIWITASVFLILLGFIVVLLFNIKKRKRAQRGLQNIITMASSLMDYQSLDSFREALVEQLSILLPIKNAPLLMRVQNQGNDTEQGRTYRQQSERDRKELDELPHQAGELIDNALDEEKCIVKKKDGVAYFKSEYLPGNIVYLEGKRGFDDLDRDLLEIFANNVIMSVENIEKHKIEESLETAKRIQMSMLPKNFAAFSAEHAVDLHAFLTPAKEVGGDLYDFFAIDSDNLCFLVGDVAGKGIPAALFMAMSKSLIRSASENNREPDQIITKANNVLSRDNDQAMFVTVFLGIYNLKSRILSYTSAGHNPPYVVSASGEVTSLEPEPSVVLGILEGAPYIVESVKLHEGDGLFMFSDGVTEALNNDLELFGEERLEKALAKHHAETPEELNKCILKELQTFVDGAPQSDDIAMLCVRV